MAEVAATPAKLSDAELAEKRKVRLALAIRCSSNPLLLAIQCDQVIAAAAEQRAAPASDSIGTRAEEMICETREGLAQLAAAAAKAIALRSAAHIEFGYVMLWTGRQLKPRLPR